MDIRNFFGVVRPKTKQDSSPPPSGGKRKANGTRGKRKRQLESAESNDDEDFVTLSPGSSGVGRSSSNSGGRKAGGKPAKLKKLAVIYDSDSDEDVVPSKGKAAQKPSTSKPAKAQPAAKPKLVLSPSPPKKKQTTTVSDFFGSSPAQRSAKKAPPKREELSEDSSSKKRKLTKDEVHDDKDFQKTLEQLDQDHKTPTKKLKTEEMKSAEKSSPSRRSPRIYKMDSSPATKRVKGVASKLADKLHATGQTLVEDTPDRGRGQRSSSRSEVVIEDTPLRAAHSRTTRTMEESPLKFSGKSTPSKATPSKATPSKATPSKATPTKATPSKATPTKATPTKATPTKATLSKAKPTKAAPVKPAIQAPPTDDPASKAPATKATPKKGGAAPSKATPTKSGEDQGGAASGQHSAEKKKGGGANYRRYLNREGPRSLGAKEFPRGEENCLAGLTFVLTGVLDYIEKEEAKVNIESLGGKVTTGVTKKTSYLVTGRDPGPAKIQKAESQGTTILTEEELFDLVRARPGSKPSTSKEPVAAKKKPSPAKEPSIPKSGRPKAGATHVGEPSTSVAPVAPSRGRKANGPGKEEEEKEKEAEAGEWENLLWVDKYKPQSLKQLIGQQGDRSCANKLLKWLRRWHDNNFGANKERARHSKDDGFCFKAALLSGPPGIGKTTTAELVCKALGYKTLELNASSSRSKKTLDMVMKEFLHTDSIESFLKVKGRAGSEAKVEVHRQCLLMDEVDGMSGNEDRGGVQEFIQMIKKSHIPVICMCNDRNHPKIRSLANHCFDLRFYRPQVKQIKGAMLSIAFKEGVSIPPLAMDHIITASNQDIRQVLHNMSMWSAGKKKLSQEQVDSDAEKAKKDLKLGPWDVLKQVFACGEDADRMSLNDKMGLFFHDYSIAPLFVQENYLSVTPKKARGDIKKHLSQLSEAADSICCGDLVDRKIRSSQRWSLLPTQAVFASVLPGAAMKGYMRGMITFPSWLGKNSSRNKNRRFLQELQEHMRLSASASLNDINFDYAPRLRHFLTQPLLNQGSEGVSEVVSLLNGYDLTREDFDTVLDVSQFEGRSKPMANVPSKVKAAFTRAFNKEGHLMPYSHGNVSKKRGSAMATEEAEGYGEGEEGAESAVKEEGEGDSEDDADIGKNPMIKVKTSKAGGQGSKVKPVGRGKGTGKGKSKK